MKLNNILITAAALVFSASAFATPQFTGSTFGPTQFDALGPNDQVAAGTNDGYYIWNDVLAPNSWHIRWTSPNQMSNPSWAGSISFSDAFNSDPSGSVDPAVATIDFSWDGGDVLVENGSDNIAYTAVTNTAGNYDGLDFSLVDPNANPGYVIRFNLLTSFFTAGTVTDDPGVASNHIFIGEDGLGTNVLVSNNQGFPTTDTFPATGTYQTFEILVPEPSIIALFGLGLVGMGFAARRRKQS